MERSFGVRWSDQARRPARGVVHDHVRVLFASRFVREVQARAHVRMEPLVPKELVLLRDGDVGLADAQPRRFVGRRSVDGELPVVVLRALRAGADIHLRFQVIRPVPARAAASVEDGVQPVVVWSEVVRRRIVPQVLPSDDGMRVAPDESCCRSSALGAGWRRDGHQRGGERRCEDYGFHALKGAMRRRSGSPPSFVAQRDERIHACGPSRRYVGARCRERKGYRSLRHWPRRVPTLHGRLVFFFPGPASTGFGTVNVRLNFAIEALTVAAFANSAFASDNAFGVSAFASV